jgi:F-type H+-transporting ATPase subunit b
LEKLGLNPGFLVVQIFNFFIIFVVLRAWVYKPLMGMLEKRKQTIAQGLEDARVAQEARAKAESQAQEIVTSAQADAKKIIKEANDKAEAIKRDAQAEANTYAAKAVEGKVAELDVERDRILSEVRGDVTALAIAASQKLIGASLDEARQRALLQEFFSGVKSGKVVLLEQEQIAGSSAEVTSALPLTADEQKAIQQDMLGRLGGTAAISFRVDPSILGGLVVRVGDRVVDGSVAAQLKNLRQSLQ